MKKSLVTLLALCGSGIACAQSSVTLFGVVDTNLTHGSGSVSSKGHLNNSGHTPSRLGFRGTEDLGGGMSASFWLEAGFSSDDGQGQATNANNQPIPAAAPAVRPGTQGFTFNRRSILSLAGSLGELRVGRDYTAHFWNQTVFDPFGTTGVGATQVLVGGLGGLSAANGVRSSNAVSYVMPSNLGGFYGQLQHFLGENNSGAASSNDGKGTSMRVGYANKALNVAAATGVTRFATGDLKVSNIGASYDFGMAQLMGEIYRDRLGAPAVSGKGYLIGALVPAAIGQVRASYSVYQADAAGNPKGAKVSLGYVHNLSKRTALYATYAHLRNSGGSAMALGGAVTGVNQASSGYDLGIRHNF